MTYIEDIKLVADQIAARRSMLIIHFSPQPKLMKQTDQQNAKCQSASISVSPHHSNHPSPPVYFPIEACLEYSVADSRQGENRTIMATKVDIFIFKRDKLNFTFIQNSCNLVGT